MQFCRARFKGRSRRWVGLDPYINQALPAELRTLDQMCMSEQYYFLGAFHCGGIMMAVLGMLLVLKSGGGSATSGALDRPPFWGRAAAILTPPSLSAHRPSVPRVNGDYDSAAPTRQGPLYASR